MDSSLHGAPVSAIQMDPKSAAPSHNTLSGIRAPLTVDESDFEYSVSSKGRRDSAASSYYSGSEPESEGFVNGEDEFRSASGSRFESYRDEEVLEETHFVKEYEFYKGYMVKTTGEIVQELSSEEDENGFPRTFVESPDDGFGQESGSFSGNAFLRPYVRNAYQRIYKGISSVNDSDDSREFLSDSGDEVVENEDYVVNNANSRPIVAVRNEGVSDDELTPVVDIKFPLVKKLSVPVAQISGDSDYESEASEALEEQGFLGIVRSPSSEVLQRVSSAPKVRMSDDDERDDYALQDENMVEMESVEDLVISDGILSCKDETEHIGMEGSIHSDTIQDKGPDTNQEARDDSLVVKEDLTHFGVEIQEIDVINDHSEHTDLAEGIVNAGNMSSVDSAAAAGCPHGTVEPMDVGNAKNSNASLEDNVVFNTDIESESEQEIDLNAESSSPVAAYETRSAYQCVDIEETTIEGCPEFPEFPKSLRESTQVGISDSVLRDASSIGVSNAPTSVFEDTELDQKMGKESENSEHLPVEAADMEREEHSASLILLDRTQEIDGQIVTDSDEGHLESDSADPSLTRPIVEARSPNIFMPPSVNGELEAVLSESEKRKLEKIRQIRIKYLQLLHRLGRSPEDAVASKVLHELTVAETRSLSQTFNFDSARKAAVELETQTKGDLEFSLCILVIGKTGVGKSATINSIFGEKKTVTDAFEPATSRVKEIIGTIDGFKVKVFDTPGLRTSPTDESINWKVLSSIKKLMQKSPPDVVLYVDRLDTHTGNLSDLPVLRLLTSYLGSSIWQKSIVVLTHAASTPPDGPDGYPLSYEVFVAQKSRIIQQNISFLSVELLTNPGSMIPVSLVENHPFAKTNDFGESNGENWRLQLLYFCYSIKISSEVSSLITVQNLLNHRRPFGSKIRSLSLLYFLSSLLQSKGVDSDTEPGYSSDSRSKMRLQAYSLKGETEIKNSKKNKTAARVSIAFFDENTVYGLKIEDRFAVGKQLILTGNAGFVRSQDNAADGLNLDLCRQDEYYHIDQREASVGLSVMRYRGDLTRGCNIQSQFCVCRNSKVNVRGGLNNKLRGQICIKISCSDQLQIAALAFIPIAKVLFKKIFPQSTKD